MAEKKRYHIGLMIHHLENEYATEVLKGAMIAAEELDINLILLPGRGINAIEDDEKYSIFDYQNNVIYSYVSSQNLDALIVSAGTIGSYISQKEMLRFLKAYKNLPILTMEVEYPGYPCIHFNINGMKLAVDQRCGCRKIGYVSGPIGNADAMERLSCYRIALEENHIPYNSNLVGYGNFSEVSEDAVRRILDENPDLDAMCFANDKMCIGGYHVFEERGMQVGKDTLVTGFDDSEIATSLKPMLTTIRTNVSDMGYRSVYAALELIQTGHTNSISLNATLIVRESCGCSMDEEVMEEQFSSVIKNRSSEDIISFIFNKYIGGIESLKKTKFVQSVWELMEHMIEVAFGGSILSSETYNTKIEQIFQQTDTIQIPIPIPLLKKILVHVKNTAALICVDKLSTLVTIDEIYESFIDHLIDYSIQQQYMLRTNLVYSNFLISNINKDMMINCNDEEKSFFSIVNNLYRVNFKSSYIYVFRTPIIHYQYEKWNTPDSFCLKSYHIGKTLQTVDPPEQEIPVYDCIKNEYTPKDRRFTFVLVPLFSNEEQYGLFVCELDLNHFSQIYSAAPQICTAIKMTRLVKELEGNLRAARYDNQRLERISDSDELTGAYNRRGFYRVSNILLQNTASHEKSAILLLADLDNLKTINDTFGHDEGDHAIRTCISYLNACVPLLDVIGRIGGDEFAAFALVKDAEIAAQEIYDSIKKTAQQYNAMSDKPYNITVSIGMHFLTCGGDETIQNYVKFADKALYEDKKKKNRIVLKSKD